jgi:regulator of cell morphogenesis and NO signaling
MADVVHHDIQLLAVIQRLDIPLGFREKTVTEVCNEHQVDVSFFLELANSFIDKTQFSETKFMDFPVDWIIAYLRKAHQCYLEHRIPEIDKQINQLENKAHSRDKNMTLLLNFFREYVNEFTSHILLEENDVFPYILELNNFINNDESPKKINPLSEHSITDYLEAHNNIEEKLYDLKNILLKYLPPPLNDCTYNHLIFDIFRLENDLKDHADLEEKVLFPRVKIMEAEIRQLTSNQ